MSASRESSEPSWTSALKSDVRCVFRRKSCSRWNAATFGALGTAGEDRTTGTFAEGTLEGFVLIFKKAGWKRCSHDGDRLRETQHWWHGPSSARSPSAFRKEQMKEKLTASAELRRSVSASDRKFFPRAPASLAAQNSIRSAGVRTPPRTAETATTHWRRPGAVLSGRRGSAHTRTVAGNVGAAGLHGICDRRGGA